MITFNSLAGALPLLYATAGLLTPPTVASISVQELQPGTNAILVYDGSNVPEIRAVRIPNLSRDTTYAFKVVPLNWLGDGILSGATITVVTAGGASAAYTTASGSSLVKGITYGIDEQQIIQTANCANSSIVSIHSLPIPLQCSI